MATQPNLKYGHGGRIYALARKLGLSPDKIIDFSASINPLGPPPAVLEALHAEMELLLVHYPEVEAAGLSETLARRLKLDPAQVAAANGSTEPIHLLPRLAQALGLTPKALIVAPAFSEYRAGLEAAGWPFDYHCCRKEDGFVPRPEELLAKAGQGYGLVFLAQPANPTGVLTDTGLILELADLQAAKGGLAVIDEAFIDFCPENSVLNQLDKHPGLVILRSLTKFYALPGLRLGLMAARPEVISALRACQHPWSVNALAQRAGLMCLDQEEYGLATRKLIAAQRDWMSRELRTLGLDLWPSAVNYLMVRLAENHPATDRVIEALMERALLVRDCANFAGLEEGYLRLAVRSEAENRRLIAALAEVLKG